MKRSVRKSHVVESSAIKNPLCREFNEKQVTLYRDQLERSHPVENSATNKSPCRDFSYIQTDYPVNISVIDTSPPVVGEVTL